jgi:hypothetical protein
MEETFTDKVLTRIAIEELPEEAHYVRYQIHSATFTRVLLTDWLTISTLVRIERAINR